MKFKNLIIAITTLTFLNQQPIASNNLENLLQPNKPLFLDLDNDGREEKISLDYDCDSEIVLIESKNKENICYLDSCILGKFNLSEKNNKYFFIISENIYGVIGSESCLDGSYFVGEEMWRYSKFRDKDKYVWKSNNLEAINNWTVQIASFPNKENAIKYIDKLLNEGFDVYISPILIDNKEWDRVFLGSYKTKEEAIDASIKFKDKFQNTKPFVKLKKSLVKCEPYNQ